MVGRLILFIGACFLFANPMPGCLMLDGSAWGKRRWKHLRLGKNKISGYL